MKSNKKGFTLIELLAVIIILGVLLLIAIPAVSKYIEQSRIKTFNSTLSGYVDSVRNDVNSMIDDRYTFSSDEVLIVPFNKIELEKGNTDKSPFGIYTTGYIAVIHSTSGYEYYVTALSNGYGVNGASSNKITVTKLTSVTAQPAANAKLTFNGDEHIVKLVS